MTLTYRGDVHQRLKQLSELMEPTRSSRLCSRCASGAALRAAALSALERGAQTNGDTDLDFSALTKNRVTSFVHGSIQWKFVATARTSRDRAADRKMTAAAPPTYRRPSSAETPRDIRAGPARLDGRSCERRRASVPRCPAEAPAGDRAGRSISSGSTARSVLGRSNR